MNSTIRSPDDKALADLCDALRAKADEVDTSGQWPAESLRLCARAGVFEWFLPAAYGGRDWSDLDIVRGYLQLSAACLTTTFIITQRTGACRRIVDADREDQRRLWLPGLATGEYFATVGISHLTTSRRHLARPAMQAEPARDGYILDGFSPWVTGADHADVIVLGATLADGRQILVAVPKDAPGVIVQEPVQLVGLSSSHTGEVRCKHVHAQNAWLLAGPRENVMAHGSGAGTGGLQLPRWRLAWRPRALTISPSNQNAART